MSSSISNILSTRMSRRSAIRTFAGAGAAAFAIATVGMAAAEHTSQHYTVSTNANFRTGPGTGYSIISVIRTGETFTYNGYTENDFSSVTYQGRNGWVYASLIVGAGGTSGDPVIVGEKRATANVNLRSGPSTGNQVLRVVYAGTWVQVSDTVQNGFRYVIHNGLAGWISDQYLSAGGDDQSGNYRTTTTRLNLRAEPTTSAKVLTVMPAGAKVQLLHTGANGFGNVNYNGMQGWAYLDYLK